MRRGWHVPLVVFILLGCKSKEPTVQEGGAAPTVSAAPIASTVFACVPIDLVNADKASIGFDVTDLDGLAAAAVGDKAIISFSVDGNHGCDHDGCYEYNQAFAIDVDGAKASKPYHLKTSATGISPSESAAPFAIGDGLFVLTQGHRGAAGIAEPGHDEPDTQYVLDGNQPKHKWSESIGGDYAVASAGPVMWAINSGQKEAFGQYFIRAFRIEAATRSKAQLATTSDANISALAIAASSTRVFIAYRAKPMGRINPPTIRAAWIDPTTAKLIGAFEVIASGDVGAPTVAIESDTAHIVWAQKTVGGTYGLMRSTWASTDPKPSAGIALTPPSALAPALARVGNVFALAWMEGDEKAVGRVHAGFGATIEAASISAIVRSAADVKNARDPEWASAGDHALLAWTEHDGPRRVRGAWCR